MSKQQVLKTYGNLPLRFESNHGQTDKQVNFLARSHGYTLFLTPTEAVLVIGKPNSPKSQHRKRETPRSAEAEADHARKTTVVRMQLLGANSHPRMVGLDELPGKSNYFIGNNPKAWHTNVPNYAKVRYEAVYPGVDLIYYGNQHQLEYDFVVTPGADPEGIRLAFKGTDKLSLDADGDLILRTLGGALRLHKPIIYQYINGVKETIPGRYLLKGKRQVGFHVANYDSSKPLVIDPVLSYSTYLGGTDIDEGHGIAVDGCGNAYVTGSTASTDFPTTAGAFDTTFGGGGGITDAFVTKLNPAGSGLVYSTYLGGSSSDQGLGIALDSAGNAYVTGESDSANFPITPTTAFQVAKGAGVDAFVAKLNPAAAGAASLVYSTFLGGSSTDRGSGIAVDASGNAYVTGVTDSANFPITPLTAFQDTKGAGFDAFVTKVNPAAAGAASLVYSTFLGGTGIEEGRGIAVDAAGSAYVTGFTESSVTFPITAGAFQTTFGGVEDAFVTKLNATGSELSYSTFLGGSSNDEGSGIAVDSSGNAYVTGETFSTDFPTATPLQAASAGNTDAFVTKLDATGSTLSYSTYRGGTLDDRSFAIAVDSARNAYVTGATDSANFSTPGAFQTVLGSIPDAFVAKIAENTTDADLCLTKTDSPDPVVVSRDLTYTLTVTNIGPNTATGVVVTDPLPNGVIFLSSSPSQGTCTGTITVTCTLGVLAPNGSATVTILINPTVVGTLNNTASVTSGTSDPNPSNNISTASTTVSATPPAGTGVDGCFIATASFGSPMAAEVEILRAFRDRYLLPHTPGRWAVAVYYRTSPWFAEQIREDEVLRAAARTVLWPVVWWAHLVLTWPVLALALGGGTLLAGGFGPYYLLRARRIQGPRGP